MKRIYTLLLMALLIPGTAAEAARQINVLQEIRYVSSEATETYIVWGINNWHVPPRELWPEGSFIKEGKLYSPMKQKPFGFCATLKVKQNTLINYLFWIPLGPAGKEVNAWDSNIAPHSEYQVLANDNNLLLINPKIKLRPIAALSMLDVSIPLLSFCATLFFLFLAMRSQRQGTLAFQKGPLKMVASAAIVLAGMLILIRTSVTGQSWDLYLHPLAFFPKVLWAGFYDVLFVMVISGLFALLIHVSVKQEMRMLISRIFVLLSFGMLIMALAFSDPRRFSALNATDALSVAMICLSGFLCGLMLLMMADTLVRKMKMKRILSSSLSAACVAYLAIAPFAIRNYNWEFGRLANPAIAATSHMHFPQASFALLESIRKEPAVFSQEVSNTLSFFSASTPAGCIRICAPLLREKERLFPVK